MQKTKMKKRCRDGVTCVVLCILPSIYLVCVFFGTAIPTSFYIFGKCFSYLYDYVSFSCYSTRSSKGLKLRHTVSRTNAVGHFYFNRLPRLWNSLPVIDLDKSLPSIKNLLKQFFWQQFLLKFNSDNPCTYHFVCPCAKCSHSSITCNFTHS